MTIPVDEEARSFIRPEIVLEGLDPHGDYVGQIKDGLATAASAFTEIDGSLSASIGDLVEGLRLARPGEVDRLATVEAGLSAVTGTINALIRRLREDATADAVAEATTTAEDGEGDGSEEG